VTALKATGLIVEYNPFHNGHIYHAQEAKAVTNADVLIAVMSGNFLQRGEPAFIDKWARTKMALQGGVDLVFELPYAFATAHAPSFAKGAIQILDAARCQSFCFGSEEGEIKPFQNSTELIKLHKDTYERIASEAMTRGLSYPKALNEAYRSISDLSASNQPTVDLTKPNNILGYHYIQAAQTIKSNMNAFTIPRMGANYHDDIVVGSKIASATGIRNSFFNSDNLDSIRGFMPNATTKELSSWQTNNEAFGSWSSFYPLLRYTIIREGPKRLATIADISEGIEHLIYRAAKNNTTFEGFMSVVKSKRYTWTRIQRMLTHIFTGFTYEQRRAIPEPSYLRLLGMTEAGQLYLNKNKKQFGLPLISKVANFSDESLEMDIHAADMYALVNTPSKVGADYKTSPIMIKRTL